jgi:hypothetical protein
VGATGWDEHGVVREPIPARWHSRLAALSSPHAKSTLRRLLVDSSFTTDGVDTTSPTVALVSGEDTTLLAAAALPTVADPPTYLHRKRYQTDAVAGAETTDVQVQIEWNPTDGVADLVEAELYDVTVEYEPGQQG